MFELSGTLVRDSCGSSGSLIMNAGVELLVRDTGTPHSHTPTPTNVLFLQEPKFNWVQILCLRLRKSESTLTSCDFLENLEMINS